jgi:uncharacterized phage protein gp47/JayE
VPEYGLTLTGFVAPMTSDIRAETEQDLQLSFYKSLPLGDKTVLGHVVGIISERLGLAWETLAAIVAAMDPDQATGFLLQALCAITGTYPQDATPSLVSVEWLCGSPGTTVPIDSVVATSSTSQNFDTASTVTMLALTAWVVSNPQNVGDLVTANGLCFICTIAGVTNSSGFGPATDSTAVTDGSVTWQCVGVGTGAISVQMTSENAGPVVAIALDLTSIQTPVSGWQSARNLLDATLGDVADTDETLRIRREAELSAAGASTAGALQGQLEQLEGVESVTIFNNVLDTTDDNNVPAHSFETLILGGDDQSIVDLIGENQPEGIDTYSANETSGTYTDSEGNESVVYYTRPTNVLMYVYVVVAYNALTYPSDGDVEIESAISIWGQGLGTEFNIDPSAVGAQAFSVAGVLGATPVWVYDDVIATPVAWAATTGYSATVGARSVVTNDGGRAYICIQTGTSGSTGPTGIGTSIADGSVLWYFLGNVYPITQRQQAIFDTSRITISSAPRAV